MQYELRFSSAAQYEFELSAARSVPANDDAHPVLPPAEPTNVDPAPASRRAG
jgi:hypothetical protein